MGLFSGLNRIQQKLRSKPAKAPARQIGTVAKGGKNKKASTGAKAGIGHAGRAARPAKGVHPGRAVAPARAKAPAPAPSSLHASRTAAAASFFKRFRRAGA
jgi:hypothetical protein